MKKVLMGVMAVALSLVSVGAMVGGEAYAAVKCPTGTLHDGKDKPSYAQCNINDEDENQDTASLWEKVNTAINVVIGVMGIVAVIVVILGAFNFLTSQGDASKVTKGKNTIIWGIVGLIVAIMAFAIVNFILSSVFGGGDGGASGSGGTTQQQSTGGGGE